MNKILLLILAVLLMMSITLAGCNPVTTTVKPNALSASWAQKQAAALTALDEGDFPFSLTQGDSRKTGGELDVNKYFNVLTHLSMDDGYILDWVYYFNGSAGSPVLYTRPADADPFINYDEFSRAANKFTRPENDLTMVWMVMGESNTVNGNRIKIDGTKEGYFEYTLLQLLGQQFYLFWHAAYNDTRIVCETAALEGIIEELKNTEFNPIDNGFIKDARKIDLQPTVQISGDTVAVSLVTFSAWVGFSRVTFTMNKTYPHEVTGYEQETLVEYNCGIMF